MTLKVIAYALNGHTDKFGIPRQSREESPILTRIVFEPDYNVPEALRGIEGYSHLWLIWGFSEVPFRPNPIGLSSVRLVRVGQGELVVSGADVLDGTPIYDIKPYLSFSDSHPDAKNGFAEETKDYQLEVKWQVEGTTSIAEDKRYGLGLPRDTKDAISYILAQDPRPAYQDDPEREYKMDYGGYTVTFSVNKQVVVVKKIEKT